MSRPIFKQMPHLSEAGQLVLSASILEQFARDITERMDLEALIELLLAVETLPSDELVSRGQDRARVMLKLARAAETYAQVWRDNKPPGA